MTDSVFFSVAPSESSDRSPTPVRYAKSEHRSLTGSQATRGESGERQATSPDRYVKDNQDAPRQRSGSIFAREGNRPSVELADHRPSEGEQAIREWHANQIAQYQAKVQLLHLEYDAGKYFGVAFGVIGNVVLHLCLKRQGTSTAEPEPETFIYGVWMGSIVHNVGIFALFLALTIWTWATGNQLALIFVCFAVLFLAISIAVGCVAFSERKSCAYEGMKLRSIPSDLPPVEHLIHAEQTERVFSARETSPTGGDSGIGRSFRRSSSIRSPNRRASITSALRDDQEMIKELRTKQSTSADELRDQLNKFRFSQRLNSVVMEDA